MGEKSPGIRRFPRCEGAVRPFGSLEPLEPRQLLSGSLMITEFMADNASTLQDVDGEYNDWIELQNTSDAAINLLNWKLRDGSATWTFPSKTLAPGEIIVVFASDKNRTNPANQLHTNFKLSKDGELLQLIRPTGVVEQEFNPFPEQFEDISYGVSQEGETLLAAGAPVKYLVPTAGQSGLGTTWTQPAFNDASFSTTAPTPGPSSILITELATGAEFIEIQNVSSHVIDTAGWRLVISNGNTTSANATQRVLPPTLAPGEVLFISDSGADPIGNQWGAGMTWSTSSGGWAMLVSDEGQVVDFVSWGFGEGTISALPAVTVNGVQISGANLPWTGAGVSSANDSGSNSLKRTGTTDSNNASNFAFTSGQTKGTANVGLTTPFASGVAPAETGIGYSVGGAGAAFDVTVYRSTGAVNTLALAEALIVTPALQASVHTGRYNIIDFRGTGIGGSYFYDMPLPGMMIGQEIANYVSLSTTKIYIPHAGKWTIGAGSDDGFRLNVSGHGASMQIEFDGLRGMTNNLGVLEAPVAGYYDVRLLQFNHQGGSGVELFAAEGEHAAFSAAAFDLIGDVERGGLAAAGFETDIGANVQSQMRSVNASLWTRINFNVDDPNAYDQLTLKMKYDAGFVAYLNGVKVAERSAPASPLWNSTATAGSERATSAAAAFESINISSFLGNLVAGNNVLAIHGLNSSSGDADFILVPEISAGITGGTYQFFGGPTPGTANSGGFLAFVEDTNFSVGRGFYDAPFLLAITSDTDGASIRYTTDGSLPTPTTGLIYTAPINIDKTTILRAIAYKNGFEPTDVDTQTYFFLSDILTQSADGSAPAGWPTTSVNGQVFNYGMDPDIVNNPSWSPYMVEALTDIPSLSIVTDLAHLFNPTTGIYVNAQQDGELWERPISLELIDPLGLEDGFQIDAGLRLRGGFSRSPSNPKHSFRFFFNGDYDGDLQYALFGDDPDAAEQFDKMDLRTAQNYSWAFGGDAQNIMNRDVFFRDLQADMGDPHTRSRYYHLYLNGQYFGLYQTQERSEANFAAEYFGGEPEDYDVVKVEAGPYTINATDGTLDAWNALWTLATQGFETDAKYFAVQGKNADGSRNPALPVYIDQSNLIDYMINILYGGNLDAPISNFLGNNSPNNWYGIYNRTTQDQGFQFFAHDSEHTLLTSNVNTNRNGPFPAGDTFDKSNPQWIHQQLMFHPEYRMAFADRVQELFFHDGPLTVENNIERFLERAAQIEMAIIAESARWGDSKVVTPYTKETWQNAINAVLTGFFPQRNDIVISQFRNTTLRTGAVARLFPSIDAPSFNVHGGVVGPEFPISIIAPNGVVYYTLDGSDPRLPGGGINPNALIYDGSAVNSTLIATSSTWAYLDNGTNQGTAWREPIFNDAGWSSGPAQFGYGDGDEATIVGSGPDPNNRYMTTYFRKQFNVTDAAEITSLTLRLLRDDGAAVYINGQRVALSNLPDNYDYLTPALQLVADPEEDAFFDFVVNPALLVEGINTIAVEVHQLVGNSTDLSFDLELRAIRPAGDPITLSDSGAVRSRALHNGEWSAMNEATFLVNTPPTSASLVVTEVHYNPPVATPAELLFDPMLNPDEFEFIELRNIGTEAIDLYGVEFSAGLTFSFTDSQLQVLEPGQHVVIVSNLVAFELRYGTGLPIAGEYTGQLADGGEQITIVDYNDAILIDFTYDDTGSWPGRADGGGSSLERNSTTGDDDEGDDWRSSSDYNGSPGTTGLGPDNRIVVNEVLSHTDPPLKDTIEIFNTTASAINISGWFISDSTGNLSKYRIPNGTTIAAGGYLVFDEDDFNPGAGTLANDFSFNAAEGDSAYLVQADPTTGKLLRFVDAVSFGAQANAESWGRFPNATGELTPMLTRTLGSANSNPRIGPVLVSEIMYNPVMPAGGLPLDVALGDLEYIEIYNPTGQSINLTEWRIRGGIDFDFVAGTLLPANTARIIIPFDPADPLNANKLATFRSVYNLAPTVPLLGAFSGNLNNAGETVRLERPDEPPADDPTFIPRLLEDRAPYDNSNPWPAAADGNGASLQRRITGPTYGGLPTSWFAYAPSPGIVNTDAVAPRVSQVLISSTAWSPAFLTYLQANALGTGGFALPTGSNQLRSITWTNVNIVAIRFNENVIVDPARLELLGVTYSQAGVQSFVYDPVTFTATWTLATALAADKWLIDLSDLVTDTAGNPLNGEWTTSSSAFPSGNASAGGDFRFRFNVLPGDVNNVDGVTATDVTLVRDLQFRSTTHPEYNYRYDINGNGSILGDDVTLVRNRPVTTLPAGEPVPISQPLVPVTQPPFVPISVDPLQPGGAAGDPQGEVAAARNAALYSAFLSLKSLVEKATPPARAAEASAWNRTVQQMPGLWTYTIKDRKATLHSALKTVAARKAY